MSGDHKTLIKGSPSQYVKLNVGGTLFYTTIGTLTKSDNMLRTMFSGRMEVLTDSEGKVGLQCNCLIWHNFQMFSLIFETSFLGWILIDRCGKHFGTILNYLRDGTVALPDNYRDINELLAEAKYFLIEELTESCQQALAKKERDAEPICRVPLITSQKEEQLLIMATAKVSLRTVY